MKKLNQLIRLFYTVRYIRFIQLYYQVWYRLKRKFLSIHWYTKYVNTRIVFYSTKIDRILYVPECAIIKNLSFTLLGFTHQFDGKVDWSFDTHGKLWNYNLQYLHYLLDDSIPINHRTQFLLDISEELLSGSLVLEPYPVSLRIVNTLLFLQRTGIRDPKIERALLQQVDYLDHNLEYHLLANHLLENYFALFIAAQYLKNEILSRKYAKRLLAALQEQILADGGHFECTPMYQSILLSKLMLCIEVGRQSVLVTSDILHELTKKASSMAGWLQAYSFPDDTWALFNDAAEKIAATTKQIKEAAAYLEIPVKDSILNESGFCKMCAKDWELIVKTGAIQPSFQPGHVHADLGSFCLWHQGIQYIIDPGISTYAVSQQRSIERSTAVHNTLVISDINQSDVWGGFRVGKRARVLLKDCTKNSITLLMEGYGNRKILFERSFVAEATHIDINDRVEVKNGKYPADIKGSILFNPAIELQKTQHDQVKANNLSISFAGDGFEIYNAEAACQYNQLVQTKKILYKLGKMGGAVTIRFQ